MNTDKICICCGKSLSSGGRNKLASRIGLIFFVGMAILLTIAIPSPSPGSAKFSEVVAHSITYGLFCMAAGIVGMVIGWVLGALFSD